MGERTNQKRALKNMDNLKEIDEKWIKKWEEQQIFDADPVENRKKAFVTFPFPYMNGPLHLGHAFTSTRCDVFARYKRMQGHNVLFPWSWHITGEPITGAAERVKKNDSAQLRIFREIDHVPEGELKKFTDPEYIARYYIGKSKEAIRRLCLSIDWRREFTTTSLHPQFNKFIEWQYLTLKKKGYVTKGTHPVVWCQNCESPTGDHDRLKGEGASPVEFILLKFKLNIAIAGAKDSRSCSRNVFLPAATLRPETIFGVTNMWLNPESTLVKAKVGNEEWIISREAANKLKEQKDGVKIVGELKASELIGKHCLHPITNEKVIILPASFVDPDNASGIVMSVPSHAPYDWAALKELISNLGKVEKYGIVEEAIKKIKPISLIATEAFGEHPAVEICEKMKIENQDDARLEEATETIYKEEFYKGVLKANTGKYKGMKVAEVKKTLVKDFGEAGIADKMYELSEKVVCRCSNECIVKILKDQWFLNFSDEKWKDAARQALKNINVLPDEARSNFEHTIDWLEAKACARKTGLGTPLPWDKEWKVETLSDSTVYMAFYTIVKHVNRYSISAESLTPEVFDFIFYGKGDLKELAVKNRIDSRVLKEMRDEFTYWMPVDFRNSAKELIPNHLTFFIFHHVALFPREMWPKCIGVNGMINIEGEKMSKSTGNFVTLENALDKHGADATRAALLYSAEGLRDPDWRDKSAEDMRNKLSAFYELALGVIGAKKSRSEREMLDSWLLSRMQRHIENATAEYENMRTRSAFQSAFFDVWKDVKWYIRRGEVNKAVMVEVLETWLRLLAPYTPALCEEIWEKIGKKEFISNAKWPEVKKQLTDKTAETSEAMVEKTTEDIKNIIEVTGIKPKKIVLYTSPKWKWRVLKIASSSDQDMKSVMREVMKDENLRKIGASVNQYVVDLLKMQTKPDIEIGELKVLNDAKSFFEREFSCDVAVFDGEDERAYDPMKKRKAASPLKPAIYME